MLEAVALLVVGLILVWFAILSFINFLMFISLKIRKFRLHTYNRKHHNHIKDIQHLIEG